MDLFANYDKPLQLLKSALSSRSLYLFLDYDGTLAPLTKRISEAFLPAKTRGVLAELSRMNALKMAIISGRSVADLEKFLEIPGLVLAGNHGFHVVQNDKTLLAVANEYQNCLQSFISEFNKIVPNDDGIIIENKSFGVTVHYRLADPAKTTSAALNGLLKEAIARIDCEERLAIKHGKMFLEVVPNVAWDKGAVAEWLVEEHFGAFKEKRDGKPLVVYLGDDKTDEDVFRAIRKDVRVDSLAVFIADKRKELKKLNTNAEYYLNGTDEVCELLERISCLAKTGQVH